MTSLVDRLRSEQPYENDVKYEAADAIEELVRALSGVLKENPTPLEESVLADYAFLILIKYEEQPDD